MFDILTLASGLFTIDPDSGVRQMEDKPISVTDHTMIVIKTHADLILQGWDRLEVEVLSGESHGLTVAREDDLVRIHTSDDLDLRVPSVAQITVERVSGDANLRDISGPLQIQRVGGDLSLKNVDAVEIMSVGGDCAMASSSGALSVQRIGGDFSGADLMGPVKLEGVGGDAAFQTGGADVQVRSGGDINASLRGAASQNIRLDAGGDVQLSVPDKAGIAFDLHSRGHDITIHYGGESQNIEKRQYQATFGDGSTHISIDAGGDIRISDSPAEKPDYEDLVEEIDEHWSEVEEARSSRTEEPFSGFPFRTKEFNDHINSRVDEAMRQADTRVQDAMRRLEQRTRRLEKHGFSVPPSVPPIPRGSNRWAGPVETAAEKKPEVSDEEKALILKMLQDKKITAEEAEKLLEALEGK
jgi:DUF4097 and DUF4098 domain-containing protein YvlB